MRKSLFLVAFLAFALTARYGYSQTGYQVDVRSFGAACNGTSNDAAALQAALNAVPSTGGTVLIPCKLGIGSPGVRLSSKQNVTIRGTATGAGLRSLAPTSQGIPGFGPILFVLQNCTDCVVRDLEFDGNNVNVGPLGLDHCTRTSVLNNRIYNVGQVAGGAISATGNVRNQYVGNTIQNTSGGSSAARGMWLGNYQDSQIERYPYVAQNTLRNIGGTGLAMHPVGATVTGNLVDGTLGAAIKLVPPAGSTDASLIENNVFRRNYFHGIQLETIQNLTIRSNTIELNDNAGIYALNGLTNSLITNNIIRDNNLNRDANGWAGGVWITHANGTVISDNQIYDSRTGTARTQDCGIILNASSSGAIKNVQIKNNTSKNNTIHGIVLQTNNSGTISGVTLTGNTSINNSGYGLQIKQHTSNAITNIYELGNTLSPNGSGAIWDNTSSRISDTTPPAVSIASPGQGQTVSGTITITANATDNVAVASVQFYVDGIPVGGADTVAPFTASWNTTTVSNGSHRITATAADAAGYKTTSAAVTVNVANGGDTSGPAISGVAVSSVDADSATISWNTGEPALGRVEYGTSTSYGMASTPETQYSTNHSAVLNQLSAATTYHFRVVSTDAAGNTTRSGDFSFTTAGSGTTPTITPTSSKIVVNAWGSPSSGAYPIMELRLSGTVLARWTVTGTAQDYTLDTNAALTANLRVYFVNDAWSSGDRNLFVRSLTLNGKVYASDSPDVYSSSCQSGYLKTIGLYCNGFFEYPTAGAADGSIPPPSTTSSKIVVNAWGSPSSGAYPIMELRLGTGLLARWTVTGTAQNYTLDTSAALTDNLRVYFVNDAWSSGDRNLFVRSLTLNGKAYPSDSPDVYSSSCQSGYLKTIGLYCNGFFEYPTSGPAGP